MRNLGIIILTHDPSIIQFYELPRFYAREKAMFSRFRFTVSIDERFSSV